MMIVVSKNARVGPRVLLIFCFFLTFLSRMTFFLRFYCCLHSCCCLAFEGSKSGSSSSSSPSSPSSSSSSSSSKSSSSRASPEKWIKNVDFRIWVTFDPYEFEMYCFIIRMQISHQNWSDRPSAWKSSFRVWLRFVILEFN